MKRSARPVLIAVIWMAGFSAATLAAGCISVSGKNPPPGSPTVDLALNFGGDDGGGGGGKDASGRVDDAGNPVGTPDLGCAPNCPPPPTCTEAQTAHTYLGCDFYAVSTLNSEVNPYFEFGVVAVNPTAGTGPATVTVSRGPMVVASVTVSPGKSVSVPLPWVQTIAQVPTCPQGTCNAVVEASSFTAQGSYHVTSTLPVALYQFSPLQSEKTSTTDCQDAVAAATCHAYSNDASLLWPTSSLGQSHIVLGRGTFALTSGTFTPNPIPGFVTVVATADNTIVTVHTTANTTSGTNLAALSSGGTGQYMLNQGDVLELVTRRDTSPCTMSTKDTNDTYCDLGPTYDFTGTQVTSSAPVLVIGGHTCAFVPYNKFACDHLEEVIPPTTQWGYKVPAAPGSSWSGVEPTIYRVVSAVDNNAIRFEPATVHAPVTLSTGQYLEITSTEAFVASGTGKLAVGEYLVGGNYASLSMSILGDPAFGVLLPTDQMRPDYDVYAAPSFFAVALVLLPQGTTFSVDGAAINAAPKPIGNSGYGYLSVTLSDGPHHLSATAPFGASIIGKANYTAYMHPAGGNSLAVP